MNVTIPVGSFRRAVQLAQNLVDKKSTMPVLQNLLLETSGSSLVVRAMDSQMGTEIRVPCEVIAPGGVTISGKRLSDVLKVLGDGALRMAVGDDLSLVLSYEAGRYRLFGYSPEVFPPLVQVASGTTFPVRKSALQELIARTEYAVARQDGAFTMQGTLVEIAGTAITMIGTDGHRLALSTTELEDTGTKTSCIIPIKAIGQLRTMLTETGDEIRIGVSATQASFEGEDILFVTRLLEGEYPPYKGVIPRGTQHRLEIEKEQLVAGIRRVSALSADRAPQIKLMWGSDRMALRCEDIELGEAEDSVPAVYAGMEMTMLMNASYVLDALSGCRSERVELIMEGPEQPCLCRAVGDETYLGIVMPLELEQGEETYSGDYDYD
ncbi:MAG: DNA polymerase III subunit beta [Candidatus Schekmanbacteria bacterium]|nr:DNA polymerase III subunit beta [Candidatus Schekmanbacteria bacterium]